MEKTAWILTWVGCMLGAWSVFISVQVLKKQNDIQKMLKEIEEKKIESEERKFMKSRIDAKANMRLEAVLELLVTLDKYQAALAPLNIFLKKEAPDYVDVDRKYLEFSKHEGVDLLECEQDVFHVSSKIQLLFNFNDKEIESLTKEILTILCAVQKYRQYIREGDKEKFQDISNKLPKDAAEIAKLVATIPDIFSKYINDDISNVSKAVGLK